jgi:glycogen debranching enzyme
MAGSVDLPAEPLRRLTAVDVRIPILITGLSAAAVMGSDGDLSLIRETRGAEMDWGGVYGEGVRLTGPWWIRLGGPQRVQFTLSETLVRLETYRTRVTSHHESETCHCDQEIVALPELPGVGRRLTFFNPTREVIPWHLEASFRPELAPVLIEGIKPVEYDVLRTREGVRVTAFGSALEFASTGPGPSFLLNQQPWDGRSYHGPLDTVTLESTLEMAPNQTSTMSFIIWGGVEATVRAHPDRTRELLGTADQWSASADATWREWTGRTPRFRLPAAPEVERGYLLARDALRSLYFAPEPGFTGLVAGYPWYASLWCRDLAWMLPAVLWMGDAHWAATSLRSVFRFQARAPLPILGAAAGELPMQIGPGPVLLFGTSDTTLYYPELLRRYLAHTGDTSLVTELARSLQLTEQWARRKTDPLTGLISNGNEGAGLQEASREHGRVHYGFDAFDATIWDSTDRRSHAVDIQVLWVSALAALGELAPIMGLTAESSRWLTEAQKLRETIANRYWWAQENYLYDSLADDGSPVQKVRPNALLAIAQGVLSNERAAAAVHRAAREDLATDWGYRTLSSGDSTYSPIAYHDGQVWPIASAWAVGAAFAVGQTVQAVEGLRRWARQLDREGGTLNECYRGDRPEPFNSCFVLGFSIAPFLTLLFEGLWGLTPQSRDRTLRVQPRFPAEWSQAWLEGLSLFGGEVTLRWDRPRMTVGWRGPEALKVTGGTPELELADGAFGTFECASTPDMP